MKKVVLVLLILCSLLSFGCDSSVDPIVGKWGYNDQYNEEWRSVEYIFYDDNSFYNSSDPTSATYTWKKSSEKNVYIATGELLGYEWTVTFVLEDGDKLYRLKENGEKESPNSPYVRVDHLEE